MLRRALAGLCVGFMCIFAASCGQTYKVVSVNVTPAAGYILTTASPTGQLAAVATFSNTKTSDVTLSSNYIIEESGLNSTTAPLTIDGVPTVNVNGSGLVTASGTALACTYAETTVGGVTTITPEPYTVQVTYTNNGVIVHGYACD